MIDLNAELPRLLPKAIAWGEERERQVLAAGAPLSKRMQAVAARIGVLHPDKIRLELVDRLPSPADPELREAVLQMGLIGSSSAAITFGYGVTATRAQYDARLLSQQCRRVHHYERAGSIAFFLTEYLRQVVDHGFWDAPYEEDARQHESGD
jgi:hypothetical protein